MATINRFEELQIWQKARELCRLIHQITLGNKFSQDYFLKKQILSSSGSIMDNIAEGFERGGNKEFIQFLGIAKGSAAEVRSQLYRAIDQEYIDQSTFDQLYRFIGRDQQNDGQLYRLSETINSQRPKIQSKKALNPQL